MNKFKYILFDLDGTLIDSTPLIIESFKYTFLNHFDEVKKDEELYAYLGIPLRAPFETLYPDMVEDLLDTYRSFNENKHDNYIGVFRGINGILEKLREKGIVLGVVTSKKRHLAMRGLRLFELDKYMSIFVTPEDTEKHKPDGEPILKALEMAGIKDRNLALYVGDSTYDILCAKNAGVKSAAVGWSYIPAEELLDAEPDIVLDSPEDLLKYV